MQKGERIANRGERSAKRGEGVQRGEGSAKRRERSAKRKERIAKKSPEKEQNVKLGLKSTKWRGVNIQNEEKATAKKEKGFCASFILLILHLSPSISPSIYLKVINQ